MKISFQKKSLKNIRAYLQKVRKRNIDTAKSILCYFACWEETIGFLSIRKQKNSFFRIIKLYLKYVYGIGKQSGYEIFNLNKKKNFSNIFITWGYKNSFNKKGEFFDLYSNISSEKKKNTLWFVIYMDTVLPNKVGENVVLLFNKKIKFNFLYFIKIIFKDLVNNKFNIYYFLHYSNSYSNFGNICLEKIKVILKKNKIQRIIMPFEGQVFQKMICKYIKENHKEIRTQGFIHDFEPFYPSHSYDTCSPDTLMVSNGREKFFLNNLKWPKNKIISTSSPRYKNKEINNSLVNSICFPSDIYNQEKILDVVKRFIKLRKILNINIKKLKVRVHPKSYGKFKQEKLKKTINEIISNNLVEQKKSKSILKKKTVIVIGISSLVILALQKGFRVIQLSIDPDIQKFNKDIWKEIDCKIYSHNIIEYKKKKNIFKFHKKNIY